MAGYEASEQRQGGSLRKKNSGLSTFRKPCHWENQGKVFRLHGFTEENSEMFRAGLIAIARTEQVSNTETTMFGTKYAIDGNLASSIGVIIRFKNRLDH